MTALSRPARSRDVLLANYDDSAHIAGMHDDDRPVTLAEACRLFGDTFTPHTLRAEAARGRLNIFRLGRRDYTTLADLREMVRLCREDARPRACTSTQPAATGSFEMDRLSSERAALNQTAIMLKSSLPNTSAKSMRPRAATI